MNDIIYVYYISKSSKQTTTFALLKQFKMFYALILHHFGSTAFLVHTNISVNNYPEFSLILCLFFPAVEQIANLLKYPCRYFPMGCREAFILSKKAAHERDCPFLQLKCPFHGQCSFNGSLKDVVPHLASEHAVTPVCYSLLFQMSTTGYEMNSRN